MTGDSMNRAVFSEKRGIIIACDIATVDILERVVKETSTVQGVVGYKIGCLLGLKYGLQRIVRAISRKSGLPVIYDHQKAGTDIPALAKRLVATCKDAGILAMVIFPFSGPATLEAFAEATHDSSISLIVGAAMTHQRFFEREGGYLSNRSIERMYSTAASLGISHFVVPATRSPALQKYARLISRNCKSPSFLLPGIGTQGGSISESFRNLKGYNAYAIIGSAIYEAENMKESAKRFAAEAAESPF
jgi:orotidine-5'-phosphate decarboxylase